MGILRDMDDLVRRFGDQRFTVSDWIGGQPLPGEAERICRWLQGLVQAGRLLDCPGPRGGVGFKLVGAEIASSLRRVEKQKLEDADRQRIFDAKQVRARAEKIECAIKLLESNGYSVNKLTADGSRLS